MYRCCGCAADRADPSEPKYILTERGIGYSFSAAVEIVH